MTDHVLSFSSPIPPLLETKSDHCRLRIRFNQLSRERRLLTCLLVLFAIIMCGLLIGIFILSLTFQGRAPIVYREINTTNIGTSYGVARYGESCDYDNGCESPFICHKKSSSSPGMCRCPMDYDFKRDKCVGDLNALCTKDIDCQQYMLCSGMNDGTRRCQCQKHFDYDNDKRQCRGDYQAPCESNIDCRTNLVCNKTVTPSVCSCELFYQYHPAIRKCRGDPGAVCDRATAECVDNAECRDGACECSKQFVPDENKTCVDPCPLQTPNPSRIRYPGNCRKFIDCQQKSKTECPEPTMFNLRKQLCDYPKECARLSIKFFPSPSSSIIYLFFFRVESQTCDKMNQYDPCAKNYACTCFHRLDGPNATICIDEFSISCSELIPCESSTNRCYEAEHICVRHPRCNQLPVCYPVPIFNQQLCPSIPKIVEKF
ncbi:unnamed protein product [Rotaria socialis]|uniref:Chitin-binding type-2 domain-containing protein n=1 Tax=Rotaria socialis TaxID=392032 RepID=A0A817T2Y7_9BILA|nr:unnamed protein product [Rotaria socialis]